MNVGDSETEKFRFEVIFESTGIVFFAVSLEEKMVWVNEIRQCIKVMKTSNLFTHLKITSSNLFLSPRNSKLSSLRD